MGTSINKGSNGVFTDIAHMMPNFWLMQQIYSGISSVLLYHTNMATIWHIS